MSVELKFSIGINRAAKLDLFTLLTINKKVIECFINTFW